MHSGKSVFSRTAGKYGALPLLRSLVYSSARSTDSAVVSGSVLIPCNPKRWTDNMHLEQPAQSLLEGTSMPSNTALAACIRVTSSRSRTSPELKLDFHFPARGGNEPSSQSPRTTLTSLHSTLYSVHGKSYMRMNGPSPRLRLPEPVRMLLAVVFPAAGAVESGYGCITRKVVVVAGIR